LLDALPKILAQQPETRLLLVGGGPQEQLIKQKVQELKLEKQVVFTGRIPNNEVQSFYNQVDIFVYPRLSMRLTDLVTPLKPLEAMAQGRLVIASDVGGHQELIKNGQNGYLFKADDVDALVHSVLSLLDQPEKWDNLRSSGRQYVEQERNWGRSVSFYKKIYSGLFTEIS
jgi:glycosyltransferase involved in cell wall biosynthesis